jgi:hypothetical protein
MAFCEGMVNSDGFSSRLHGLCTMGYALRLFTCNPFASRQMYELLVEEPSESF